jgi:hypothetical protein
MSNEIKNDSKDEKKLPPVQGPEEVAETDLDDVAGGCFIFSNVCELGTNVTGGGGPKQA